MAFIHTLLVLFLSLLIGRSIGQSFTNCDLRLAVQEVDCSDVGVVFTTIPQDAPTNILRLVMTGNNISELSPGLFTRYPALEVLYLDRNQFQTLAPGWLSDLPALQELYLDGNPFSDLGEVFSNLTNLRKLSLRSTSLQSLKSEMFIGLDKLQMLLIEDNTQLSELPRDSFSHLPATIQSISLTNNRLQTIPEGLFDPLDISTVNVTLSGNPWSCDCYLEWFRSFLTSNPTFPGDRSQTNCQWPTSLTGMSIASQTVPFSCYAPSIITDPKEADILTDREFSLTCIVDGTPFPNITWLKNGQPVQYSQRVSHGLYNASLEFTMTQLGDAGVYECVAVNVNGTATSSNATLKLTESTCFDGMVSSHETDRDCGGIHCTPCNISQQCRVDSDCVENLVCLYAHQLPSQLLYISPTHPDAYTCRLSNVPQNLLDTRIQAALPTDIFAFNFTVERNISEVEDALRSVLADQLGVPSSIISGGSPDGYMITTVERNSSESQPLVQIWPAIPRNAQGQHGRQQLLELLHAGELKATVRLIEQNNLFKIRINL